MDSETPDHPFPLILTANTSSQLTDAYDQWSSTYDKDAEVGSYVAPVILAKRVADLYPSERQTVKILDIGAGTGLVGVELQKVGFQKIDGLDPCHSMLDKVCATHAYTNLFCEYFTAEPTLGIQKDHYDVIVSSGALLRGHLPYDCFIEATRIVKPGGLICMTARAEGTQNFNEHGYKDQLTAVIKQLELKKKTGKKLNGRK